MQNEQRRRRAAAAFSLVLGEREDLRDRHPDRLRTHERLPAE
jgi:hypothetical protein